MIAGVVLAIATFGAACVGNPAKEVPDLMAKGYEPAIGLIDVFGNLHTILVKKDGTWIEYIQIAKDKGCIWALGEHLFVVKSNGA